MAGDKAKLEKAVGHPIKHFKVDIRFEYGGFVVLIETKQSFVKNDEKQLSEHVDERLRSKFVGKTLLYITEII